MRASRLEEGGFTGNGEYASLEIASMEAAANAWLQVYRLGVYRRNRVTGHGCQVYVLTASYNGPGEKRAEPDGDGRMGLHDAGVWLQITEDADLPRR